MGNSWPRFFAGGEQLYHLAEEGSTPMPLLFTSNNQLCLSIGEIACFSHSVLDVNTPYAPSYRPGGEG